MRTNPITPHTISERFGNPGSPPPPSPPNRALLRRSNSSRAEPLDPPRLPRRVQRGGSPHGPVPCSLSSGAGESPRPSLLLLGPHGPLVSLNRPRTRLPSPEMIVIACEYRGAAHEIQWQGAQTFLCPPPGASR